MDEKNGVRCMAARGLDRDHHVSRILERSGLPASRVDPEDAVGSSHGGSHPNPTRASSSRSRSRSARDRESSRKRGEQKQDCQSTTHIRPLLRDPEWGSVGPLDGRPLGRVPSSDSTLQGIQIRLCAMMSACESGLGQPLRLSFYSLSPALQRQLRLQLSD